MSDFDDLLTSDWTWWQNFATSLKALEDRRTGQLALWALDDLLADKRYARCPDRGTHLKIIECWLCYGDWAWGKAELSDLLLPEERP